VRQTDVQAVADRWASGSGWAVTDVAADGPDVLVDASGPLPEPSLPVLRRELVAAGLGSLPVRVSLAVRTYLPVSP
jgi:hypothetical protein